jgi:hypothetical protein
MTDNGLIVIAGLYALMVVLSYRKVGFVTALFWPMSMFFIGMVVFIHILLTPPKE